MQTAQAVPDPWTENAVGWSNGGKKWSNQLDVDLWSVEVPTRDGVGLPMILPIVWTHSGTYLLITIFIDTSEI